MSLGPSYSGPYVWKGRTTGARYEFQTGFIPAGLLDQNGNPQSADYNGELAIVANPDGSVAPSVKTGPPADATGLAIYDAYVAFSPWDSSAP
jgi:hypothetical protein